MTNKITTQDFSLSPRTVTSLMLSADWVMF